MSKCKLSEDKVKLLKLWKDVAKNYPGDAVLHFDFKEQKDRLEKIKKFADNFLKNGNKKSFKDMWVLIYSAQKQAPRWNNVWRENDPKKLVTVIGEIKKAKSYNQKWEEEIKNAGPSTLGELFGLLHIDKHPIRNGSAKKGLEFFGFKFKEDSYHDFENKFNEFKENCYEEYVGYATKDKRYEVPINLEIDQLFNIIDKLDIRKNKNNKNKRNKVINKLEKEEPYKSDMIIKMFYRNLLKLTDNENERENDYEQIEIPISDEIKQLLYKKQIILYGPPGTGKTYNARKLAVELIELEVF